MSDKQGHGERLFVLQDGNGVLWADEDFHGITPTSHEAATRAADAANLEGNDEGYTLPLVVLGLFNPQTERVVPKDAEESEMLTVKQARALARSAVKHGVAMDGRGLLLWEPGRKMIDDLIAQARSGKGAES